MVKNLLQWERSRFDPWVRKILWRRKWQPTSVFLPGKTHGQRSLVGYSPWGHKESDTTERLTHEQLINLLICGECEYFLLIRSISSKPNSVYERK